MAAYNSPGPPQPHEATELEFAAKAVNDLLKKRFKKSKRKVAFLTFVVDEGEGGYLGYIASVRRIDAVRLIMEWLTRMIDSFDVRQIHELLVELEKELSTEEEAGGS